MACTKTGMITSAFSKLKQMFEYQNNGFKEIGLPRAVFADKDIDKTSGVEVEGKVFEVFIIPNVYTF
nr:hypothetical protein [Alkalispirochaeta alkalica]